MQGPRTTTTCEAFEAIVVIITCYYNVLQYSALKISLSILNLSGLSILSQLIWIDSAPESDIRSFSMQNWRTKRGLHFSSAEQLRDGGCGGSAADGRGQFQWLPRRGPSAGLDHGGFGRHIGRRLDFLEGSVFDCINETLQAVPAPRICP